MTYGVVKYVLSILYFVFCIAMIITTYNGVKKNDKNKSNTR